MSVVRHGSVHISAKSDYAIKAMIELAGAAPGDMLTAHEIAARQRIPLRFLLNILADLRRVGIVDSRRGPSGGWWMVRLPTEVSAADVVRAVDGPLAGHASDGLGRTDVVDELWVSVQTSIRDVLEKTTVADLVNGAAPAS
jgi:Rrf2 family protein